MSHGPHESAWNYSPAQILKDECDECHYRSQHPDVAIDHMDPETLEAAWKRAADWQHGDLRDVCAAEVPVLRVLWAVQIQLEKRGFPIGTLPAAGLVMARGAA